MHIQNPHTKQRRGLNHCVIGPAATGGYPITTLMNTQYATLAHWQAGTSVVVNNKLTGVIIQARHTWLSNDEFTSALLIDEPIAVLRATQREQIFCKRSAMEIVNTLLQQAHVNNEVSWQATHNPVIPIFNQWQTTHYAVLQRLLATEGLKLCYQYRHGLTKILITNSNERCTVASQATPHCLATIKSDDNQGCYQVAMDYQPQHTTQTAISQAIVYAGNNAGIQWRLAAHSTVCITFINGDANTPCIMGALDRHSHPASLWQANPVQLLTFNEMNSALHFSLRNDQQFLSAHKQQWHLNATDSVLSASGRQLKFQSNEKINITTPDYQHIASQININTKILNFNTQHFNVVAENTLRLKSKYLNLGGETIRLNAQKKLTVSSQSHPIQLQSKNASITFNAEQCITLNSKRLHIQWQGGELLMDSNGSIQCHTGQVAMQGGTIKVLGGTVSIGE